MAAINLSTSRCERRRRGMRTAQGVTDLDPLRSALVHRQVATHANDSQIWDLYGSGSAENELVGRSESRRGHPRHHGWGSGVSGHRIEEVASSKFRRRNTKPDGTVMVSAEDLGTIG
jgi:hypothetical protein